jgi:geranylgeranylglycerol-phosphate geranylgeranyltransferase
MFKFLMNYVKSMRLYYSFVTGIGGWAGVAYYEQLLEAGELQGPVLDLGKKAVILTLLFLSWGINQIINDFLGLKEDRINAPHRPMVTGELPVLPALALSLGLMLGATLYSGLFLSPIASGLIWVGAGLNVLYNFSKAWGAWANVVFGLMIAVSPLFGFYAAAPGLPLPWETNLWLLYAGVALLNGILTYYTYFKDYLGDKAVGQKTLVVALGLDKAKKLAVILSLLPSLAFVIAKFAFGVAVNPEFIILAVATTALHLWTGWHYYKNPQGEKTYQGLKGNFQAGVCGQASIIALFTPWLGTILFLASFFLIGFLFDQHKDAKA